MRVNKTRDSPTPRAHLDRVSKGPPKEMPVMVAEQNAAEVCPEGKLTDPTALPAR